MDWKVVIIILLRKYNKLENGIVKRQFHFVYNREYIVGNQVFLWNERKIKMSKYIPKFSKDENDLLILSDVFSVEECLKYAKEHNMRVLMECTTSTSSVEIMMLFQKNGYIHKLFEQDVYAPDGIKLSPKVLCLFEKSAVQEIINEI